MRACVRVLVGVYNLTLKIIAKCQLKRGFKVISQKMIIHPPLLLEVVLNCLIIIHEEIFVLFMTRFSRTSVNKSYYFNFNIGGIVNSSSQHKQKKIINLCAIINIIINILIIINRYIHSLFFSSELISIE